jgi:signal peptidase
MGTRVAHKKWKNAARVLNIIIGISLIGTWYINFAPTYLGGPATYALVDGVSMQPMFFTGDLIIAKARSDYAINDLIVYANNSGYVIHRIVAGNSIGGWVTKGDHNSWIDNWVVREDQILGEAQYSIGHVGIWFTWASAHPLLFASLVALLALLPYLPRHRKHLDKILVESLRFARKDPKEGGRTKTDYVVMYMTLLSTVTTLGVVVFLYAMKSLFTVLGFVILAGLWAMGLFTYFYIHRLYDGWGVIEPAKSLYALSGMTYSVDLFPHLEGKMRSTESAIELRTIAENYRLPVLHHYDSESRQHAFLVITEGHGNYYWIPQVSDQSREMLGHSIDGVGTGILLLKV